MRQPNLANADMFASKRHRYIVLFKVTFTGCLLATLNVAFLVFFCKLNPLPPSDAIRKQKIISKDLFSSVWLQFKNYQTFANLKFKKIGIFQSLKLRILGGKFLLISLKLNLTPNTVGCYSLSNAVFSVPYHKK